MLYIKIEMLYIKTTNVIYKFPIFAPPAWPNLPMLYIKTRKFIYNPQKR